MSEALTWFTSSYSNSEGGACVEVAVGPGPGAIHVRDSKLGARSPEVSFDAEAWTAFVRRAAEK